MNRTTLVGALLGAVLLLSAGSVHAALSPRNPYRSFNSGVNYGAQQWERAHQVHRGACHVRLTHRRR